MTPISIHYGLPMSMDSAPLVHVPKIVHGKNMGDRPYIILASLWIYS